MQDFMSELSINQGRHGNGNRRHDCNHCNKLINVGSKEISVSVKSTACDSYFAYHVDCWKIKSKG